MTTAQRLRLIFELQQTLKTLEEGVREAAVMGDDVIADNPNGNRHAIEAYSLLGTINEASTKLHSIIDGLKQRKSPGAGNTEATS